MRASLKPTITDLSPQCTNAHATAAASSTHAGATRLPGVATFLGVRTAMVNQSNRDFEHLCTGHFLHRYVALAIEIAPAGRPAAGVGAGERVDLLNDDSK